MAGQDSTRKVKPYRIIPHNSRFYIKIVLCLSVAGGTYVRVNF